MTLTKAGAFIRLTRPLFLLGGILLYILGVVIALANGARFHPGRFILGQILVTAVQLMVQYANEYYDRDVDQAAPEKRTWFSGGSGVLPAGLLQPGVALRAARICTGIALAVLALLAIQTPLLALLGLLELLLAWSYSVPPLRLVGRGWGELTASLITAFCVPLTGLVLQAGLNNLPPILFIMGLPLVLIHMGMLIAFEFPDMETDRAGGKRTLAVRLGGQRTAWVHNGLIGAAFGLYGVLVLSGYAGGAGRYIFLVLPLAIWQMVRVGWQLRHREAGYQLLTLGAISLFAITALLWLVGFITSAQVLMTLVNRG